MKKMFNLKSLLLLLTMFVGLNAWAETKTIVLENLGASLGSTSNTTMSTVDITAKGTSDVYTLNYLQGKKQGSAILLAKSTGAFISNNTAIPGDIKSVTVVINSGASAKTTYHCAFTTTECTSAETTGSTAVNIGAGASHKYDCGVEGAKYFCVSLGNANNGQVLSLEIEYEESDNGGSSTTVTAPTFSLSAGTYVGAQTLELSTTEENASIYYTLDGSDPTESATVLEYESPITLSATTTVKAVVMDSEANFSAVVSKTYVIEAPIANTLETAYTTAEAIDLINAGSSQLATTEVYVKGIVSKVDSYNSTYGSITYWLDDNSFEIYSGLNDEGAKFDSKDDIALEAEVVVKGIIKKYNSIYEMDKNNWLVSYNAPVAKETATITAEPKTSLEVGEYDEYVVTYNGDGVLSVASSDETVAEAIIDDNTVLVSALKAGTTTITISAPATANYYAASKTYTLTVTAKASIPFTFNGGKSAIASTPGMTQTGLGTDYSSDPKLKFDSTGDNLIINYNGSAKVLKYTIKGNSYNGGSTFDVMESEDGVNYSCIASYVDTELNTTATVETLELNSDSRYVMFVYKKKVNGNVALGNISITDGYVMNVAANELRTLCLPYAATVDGANVYSITGTYMNGSEVGGVVLEAVNDNLVAGTPYIIETTGTKVIAAYSGEAVAEPVAATGLVGNLSSTPVTVPNGNYVIGADNKLHKVAGANVTVGKYRAYINLTGVEEYTGAAAKVMGVYDAETTGINNVEALGENAVIYNVAGQRVAQPVKGINVINGRKVVIK